MRHLRIAVCVFFVLAIAPAFAGDEALFSRMLGLAQKGDAEAQYHVGMMYNNGIGTQRDLKQAFAWFEKSTAAQDPLGAYKLGCYYDGQGEGVVARDAAKALEYKLIAAKAGYSLAQHDVAGLYQRAGNAAEAFRWFKAAADQGYSRALYQVASAYDDGKGVAKDATLTYVYFKLSNLGPDKTLDPKAQPILKELASDLSKEELEKAEKFVSDFKATQSPLTQKAMSGLRAAEEHVANAAR